MKVIGTWPVASAASNFPMALDKPNRRLFVGCRRPAKVLVLTQHPAGKSSRSTSSATPTTCSTTAGGSGCTQYSGGDGSIDVFRRRTAVVSHAECTSPPARGHARRSTWRAENRLYLPSRTAALRRPRGIRGYELRD